MILLVPEQNCQCQSQCLKSIKKQSRSKNKIFWYGRTNQPEKGLNSKIIRRRSINPITCHTNLTVKCWHHTATILIKVYDRDQIQVLASPVILPSIKPYDKDSQRRRSNQGLAPYCHRSKSNGKSPGDQIAGTILLNLRCGYYQKMTDINQYNPSTSINQSQSNWWLVGDGTMNKTKDWWR